MTKQEVQAYTELKAKNKALEERVAELEGLLIPSVLLLEELNKRYLKETKKPFIWYEGFALETFIQKAKNKTKEG